MPEDDGSIPICVAIALVISLWWVFGKTATSHERAGFVQRAAAHGAVAAERVSQELQADPEMSLFTAWWVYFQNVRSAPGQGPLGIASPGPVEMKRSCDP